MIRFVLPFFLLLTHTIYCQLNTTFLGQINYSDACSNLWGWTSPSGDEYVIIGTYSGTRIVDITDPTAPDELFFIDGANSSWREVKVWDHYAYVVTEGNGDGLLCIDLSGLPSTIDYNFSDCGMSMDDAHTVTTDENGYVHIFGSDFYGGADVIVNANTDPMDPPFVGNVGTTYVHDGFVRGDTLWAANIYAGYFSVWDISNKTSPVLLATQNTPANFTHNTALSDDGNYIFTTDETTNSSVTCYDVSDVTDITYISEFRANPGTNSIAHNVYDLGNFLVTAWYKDGIIITDKTHPAHMIKTGYYDSSPAYSGSGYNGAWGVYPYFPSGTIAISDIENGLILIEPTYVQASYVQGNVTDEITGVDLFGVTVSITADASASVSTDITGNYLTGTLNAGTYTLTFSKTGYETKTISGVSLSSGSTTVLDVALESITPTCVAPVTLYETGVSSTSATLHWNNVGATSYTVTYRKTSGGTPININVSDNELSVSGLASCTSYKWKVKAKCPGGTKPVSVWKTFSTTGTGCRMNDAISLAGVYDAENDFLMYPNPVQNEIILKYSFNDETVLRVFDAAGRMLYAETILSAKDETTLNLSYIPAGMYVLQVSDGANTFTEKFVKE